MREQLKISIRFFDDHEVMAVVRNYWKYLKDKLKKENNELVSVTTQLKLMAADGKKYNTDMLDSQGVVELAKHFLNYLPQRG
jgi:cell filamentation protein